MKKFETWWGSDFFRTPGSGAFATRGFVGANISFAGDIVTQDTTFPFCVESKNEEGWELSQLLTAPKNKLQKWWKQCVEETPDGMVPLLVFTRNHTPEFFMMPGDVWVNQGFSVMYAMMPRGSVVIGLFEDLLKTNPKIWVGTKTSTRLGKDPEDIKANQAKAIKKVEHLFKE